jgi:predicted ester cyclase
VSGELRALVEAHYAQVDAKEWDAGEDVFSPDVETTMPGAGKLSGLDAFRAMGQAFATAFPDMHLSLEDVVAESEGTIVVEGRLRGTHTGPLRTPAGAEIPATGRTIDLPYCDIFEARDGRVVSHRVYFDRLELMEQLGLAPSA